jgi:hypothetical protein
VRVASICLAVLLVGCLNKTFNPVRQAEKSRKKERKREQAKPPPKPPSPLLKVHVPELCDCCADVLLKDLRALDGIRTASLADGKVLTIERDPATAPNETILGFLRDPWRLKPKIVD